MLKLVYCVGVILISWSDVSWTHEEHEETPRVLVISLDGFRHDYLDIVHTMGQATPTFDLLIREGVSVKSPGVTNLFYTKTLPNHYSIVTGLYEESHGLIANEFYDPVFNETFYPSNVNIKWWNGTGSYKVVPIWMTNEGEEHRASGVYMWVGSEVVGQQPQHVVPYNDTTPFKNRVDQIVRWYTDEQRPINFGMLYFPEPDHTGHLNGPMSSAVAEKIVELDGDINYLLEQLKSENLFHKMNIILTSDHGMVDISTTVYLSDYVDPSLYTSYGGTPVQHILPKQGHFDDVYSKLKKVPNVTVIRKEDLSESFHYKNNRRVAPLLIYADVGVMVCDSRVVCDTKLKGDHGYDNTLPSMHPIFIAHGPAFKKNYVAEPFESVDLYPLLCHLLAIQPRLNNGSFGRIKHILANSDNFDIVNMNITMITFLLSIGFAALISAVWCIGACRAQRFTRLNRSDTGWKPLQMGVVGLKSTDGHKPLLVGDEEEEDIA